jgi:hypothetical protein
MSLRWKLNDILTCSTYYYVQEAFLRSWLQNNTERWIQAYQIVFYYYLFPDVHERFHQFSIYFVTL